MTKNDPHKIESPDALLKQIHNAREILLTPTEKFRLGKIEENRVNHAKIICIPACLEAHIIALIKGGLS
jgi:hypothetical protein